MTREFHDAIIVAVGLNEDELVFEIKYVSVYSEQEFEGQESGSLIVRGLAAFRESGRSVRRPTFEFDDGEILDLTMDDCSVTITVVWENYDKKRKAVATYEVLGAKVIWVPSCFHPPEDC